MESSMQIMHEIGSDTVYLMGGSFVLGSMFTLLLLVILDWYRRKDEA